MTRAERVRASIDKAVAQGFTFYKTGTGNYEELFKQMRAEGYVVAAWYLEITKNGMMWEMYIKEKNQKKAVITQNPITGQTYYHGFQEEKKELVPMPVNPAVNIMDTYGEMTVKALREICKNRKIAGYYKMTKQQMIESLQSAC